MLFRSQLSQGGRLSRWDSCPSGTVRASGTSGTRGTEGTPGTAGTDAAWTAADWRAHYDERAGMLEYEGGLSRTEAEARARKWVTAEYMVRAHKATVPGVCAHCGEAGHDQAVIPHGTVTVGHVWLHSRCWRVWYDGQVESARDALGVMGVFDRNGTDADDQT